MLSRFPSRKGLAQRYITTKCKWGLDSPNGRDVDGLGKVLARSRPNLSHRLGPHWRHISKVRRSAVPRGLCDTRPGNRRRLHRDEQEPHSGGALVGFQCQCMLLWSEQRALLRRLTTWIQMTEQGALTSDAAEFAARHQRRWLVSNYKAGKSTYVLAPSAADVDFPGDVVFHHPCMIHCSARNLDPDNRIRLATDLRFADKHHPYDARWANNYCGCEGLVRFCNRTDPRTVFPNDGL